MKKKQIVTLALVLALVLLLTTGCQKTKQIEIGEVKYSLDTQMVDLSGASLLQSQELEKLTQLPQLNTLDLRGTGLTVKQYEELSAMLPGCKILWEVPFQGDYLSVDTTEITISALSDQDTEALAYLPGLEKIHAEECEDLAVVTALQEQFPECEISYTVQIAAQKYPWDITALDMVDADTAELMETLAYLPLMEQVTFAGVIPENDSIWELKQAYPRIRFMWEFEFFGQTVSSETTELDLSGIPMKTVEEVENGLKYFNNLQKVEMCDCGIPSEEMDALWKRHPETRFIWTVKVGNIKLRTDTTALMPFKHGYVPGAPTLKASDCKEMKYLVDMVCMDFGHMWVNDISFVQYMPNLEYFMFCENGLQDISPLAGLQKLKYLELFGNPITDISALAECPALEDINLSYCKIEDFSPLLELKNVKNLWLYGPNVSEEMSQQLQEAFPDAKHVFHVGRSTGYGWRDLPNYFAQRDLLGMPYMTTK